MEKMVMAVARFAKWWSLTDDGWEIKARKMWGCDIGTMKALPRHVRALEFAMEIEEYFRQNIVMQGGDYDPDIHLKDVECVHKHEKNTSGIKPEFRVYSYENQSKYRVVPSDNDIDVYLGKYRAQ